jgi:hypothetical protein
MKKTAKKRVPQMRREYDLASLGPSVRGKYHKRYQAGTNVVVLDPDVAKAFPDAKAVNATLRSLNSIAKSRVNRAA